MKKFLTSIVVFFTAFLLTACGLIMPQSSSQGGGGGNNGGSSGGTVMQEPFDCVMETEGILQFRNYENGEIIVVVDGKEHKVNTPTFDLYSLNLSNGRYMAIVNFYINGENQYQNYFEFFIGKEEIKGNRIVFYDYNGILIKEIFLPYGELFTQEIFPEVNDKPGVTYSWDYDVELDSELNQDLEIKQIASFTEYKVTYHLNGGNFEYEVEAKYTIENPYFMLQDPVKDGFMFDGWYENSSFNGNPISQFNTSIAKDIEVYAKWIELTAEVREIITIFEDCIQEDLVTIKGSNGESTYELALDLSGDSVYYHYKQDGKLSEVVMNNMTYHYYDMTYTTNKADKDNYKDPLSLKHLGNMIISTTKEEKNGTITYKAKVKNDDASVTIVVKNGKLASITTQQDRYKEEYNFSYNVSKEKVDVSKFTQKLEVRIFEVLVSEEGPREPSERSVEYVNKGFKLADHESIKQELEHMSFDYIGMFLDYEGKQEVSLDYVINENVSIYILRYDNFDLAINNLKFTVNVHCDCSECKGQTKTYKDITLKEINTIKHFENASKDFQEPFHKVENNKVIYGWFKSPNKEEGEAYLVNFVYEYAEAKDRKEPLVIDLYTYSEYVETVLVKEYCDCELHSNKDYVETYIMKNSWYWYWTNSHKKDGYRIEGVSLSNNLSDLQEGFELSQNSSVYFKWILDTRIEVEIFDTENKYDEYGEKLVIEKEKIYAELNQRYNQDHGDRVLEGMYLDKDCTQRITSNTVFDDGAKIYIKWTSAKRVQFSAQNGYWEEITVPENWDINNVNWDDYIGLKAIDFPSNAEERIFNLVYMSSQYGETISTFEFYKDENRTQKVSSIKGLDIVYVGYKNTPMVTFVCDETCSHDHSPQPYNMNCFIGYHIIEFESITYKVTFYYDQEYTKQVPVEYAYQPNDFTIYGKKEEFKLNLKINCNCLNHPNGIEGVYNSVSSALKDCDYGFKSMFSSYPRMYEDQKYTVEFNIGSEYSYVNVPELYVKTEGRATVYCDCDIEGHDGKGYQIVLAYFDWERQGIYDSLAMLHHEEYMGAPIEFGLYLDPDYTKHMDQEYIIKNNDKIYVYLRMDGNFSKIAIHYEDVGTQNYFESSGNYINLPYAYDNYKVVGYYLDKELTIPAPYTYEDNVYKMYCDKSITLYADIEEAEAAILYQLDNEGKEFEVKYYLFYDMTVSSLYGSIQPKFGYRSYIVDELGNRVDPTEELKAAKYYVHHEELEGYIQITIECDCQYCLYGGDYYDYHENGDISMRKQNNKLLVLPGEYIEQYISNYYNLHTYRGMDYMIGNAIISLTENGEALDQSALNIWDGDYSNVGYRYVYYEDTTLYFRPDETIKKQN